MKDPRKYLDKFAASPVGDATEYAVACAAAHEAFPAADTYIGYSRIDNRHHFQVSGDATDYSVPVSGGWRVCAKRFA